MKILVATRNRGKLRELERLLGEQAEFVTLDDVDPVPDVVEEGDTFEANAVKKAVETAVASGMVCLADDSGLEVDALDGRPGIFSARFSGEGATDKKNNTKLLAELDGVPAAERTARFRCVLALAKPDGRGGAEVLMTTAGSCEGQIGFGPKGENGFGYDPLFIPDNHSLTMAELPAEKKGALSHRGNAVRALAPQLKSWLSEQD